MRRVAAVLAVLGLLALVWPTSTPPGFAEAERRLRAAFQEWRDHVESGAEELAGLAGESDAATQFARAEEIARDHAVDGVVLLDGAGQALAWAGRTFDTADAFEMAQSSVGRESVNVLDHPAHPLLFASRPAGDGLALTFLALGERFPLQRGAADRIAQECGLHSIRLRFGSSTVPVHHADEGRARHVIVIADLVHVTMREPTATERASVDDHKRRDRRSLGLWLVVAALSLELLRRVLHRLPPSSWAMPAIVALAMIALRWFAALLRVPTWAPWLTPDVGPHPLWSGPADSLLTAGALLGAMWVLLRYARRMRREPVVYVFAGVALVASYFAPRGFRAMVASVPARIDGMLVFDPLAVIPTLEATMLLSAVCLLTIALFFLVHNARTWLRSIYPHLQWLAPLAVAAGWFARDGFVLAFGCVVAGFVVERRATRPERATMVTLLAAIVAASPLMDAHRSETAHATAARAQELLGRARSDAVQARLERATAHATDDVEGVDREVAQILVEGRPSHNVAFRIWSASRWTPGEPCAVQVWSRSGELVSAFDYDSPPAHWLPGPPNRERLGNQRLSGRGAGRAVQFHVIDFELRTIGDERLAGIVRILAPDPWDMLMAQLRPAMFGEPLDQLVSAGAPPALLVEYAPDGTPRATSAGAIADAPTPTEAVLARARRAGHAEERSRYRDQDARLIVAHGRYRFAGILFRENAWQAAAFVFAKILLAAAIACLVYMTYLAIRARGAVRLLFRHRVALVLLALSVPTILLLATHNRTAAEERHEEQIRDRLDRRLDLAATLLRQRRAEPTNEWCATVAGNHLVDINVYRGAELVATSRPGIWDTGLLSRRLDAAPYTALVLENRDDYSGVEAFVYGASLRAAYRRFDRPGEEQPLILAAPALEDRRSLDRDAAASNAPLLALYMLSAIVTALLALWLGRSLTRPVQELREATSRVAAGDLDARLPEGRHDEFGDLIAAFNRMTVELREAQDLRVRAEKAAAWREMARQIAHEIKNPLTPIKLTVQNLVAIHTDDPKSFEEEFERGAGLILDQIDALHRIAGAFSAYARFPNQRLEALDLAPVVQEVAAFYAAAGGSELVTDVRDAPLLVHADNDELRRVLINLVTNARQADATIVTLRAQREGERARIDIEDNGTGIPPDVMARIFEPSFTTKTSGTGLGMPIVKRIIDDYGGTITINSKQKEGTKVVVRLPLAAPPNAVPG